MEGDILFVPDGDRIVHYVRKQREKQLSHCKQNCLSFCVGKLLALFTFSFSHCFCSFIGSVVIFLLSLVLCTKAGTELKIVSWQIFPASPTVAVKKQKCYRLVKLTCLESVFNETI